MLKESSQLRMYLICRLSSSWPSTGMQSPSATSPFQPTCPPSGHGLARFDHAEALARAITDHRAQDQALAELVTVAAHTGDLDHAEALARAITGPDAQAQALTRLATAAAQTRHMDHASRLAADAEALVRTITYSLAQARSLTQLATVAAQTGDLDRAEALAHAITDPWDQAEALIQPGHRKRPGGRPGSR